MWVNVINNLLNYENTGESCNGQEKRDLNDVRLEKCRCVCLRTLQESDHKILAAFLKGEQEKVSTEGARRERVFADAAWMNRVIEEQLELERDREAELDFLHR